MSHFGPQRLETDGRAPPLDEAKAQFRASWERSKPMGELSPKHRRALFFLAGREVLHARLANHRGGQAGIEGSMARTGARFLPTARIWIVKRPREPQQVARGMVGDRSVLGAR